MRPRIHVLADKIPWFGQHTGYGLLPRYLEGPVRVVHSRTTHNQIRLGRWYARARGWRERTDYVYAAAELRFDLSARVYRADVHHILYGEGHHHAFEQWNAAPRNVIATLHHPPAQWAQLGARVLENLKRLQSALVLYQCDIPQFEEVVGRGRVRFVRHGVDTDFFQPPMTAPTGAPRILFAGQNGRNFEMLERVAVRLAEGHPDLRFDFLVRDTIRQRFPPLTRLMNHPAITWHENISDENLRALLQSSYLMLLPLNVCGVTNAMLEALACGLPLVTTNVGGVPDYGGGTDYPTVENDDDVGMIKLVESYLKDFTQRETIARAERIFAEQCLSWPTVAQQHSAAYAELIV